MRWLFLALPLAALIAGAGPAQADEEPKKGSPGAERRPAPGVRVYEYNGFHAISLGGSGPAYLIDPRTDTCAMVGPSGLLAVDCVKLARNLPQARDLINGTVSGTAPPTPQVSEQELDQGIRCQDGACSIERGLLDKLLADSNLLARSARIVPFTKDGRPSGFKLYGIRPGSVYARLGIRNGDLIKTVNGVAISGPDKALAASAKLRGSSELIIQVERNSEAVTLSVQIHGTGAGP